MKSYRILVNDLRAEAPAELAAEFAHDARAREFARQRLEASPSMKAIEVWRDRLKLCRFEAAA